MSGNFHEHYVADEPPGPSDRSTGLTLAAAALIAAYLWRADVAIAGLALACAAALAVTSLAAPSRLRPLNRAWTGLSLALGKITTPIVMALLFAVVIVPAGLIFRLRHDPLRRRKPDVDSYWIERERTASDMSNAF
jgi:hypothetical protein